MASKVDEITMGPERALAFAGTASNIARKAVNAPGTGMLREDTTVSPYIADDGDRILNACVDLLTPRAQLGLSRGRQ